MLKKTYQPDASIGPCLDPVSNKPTVKQNKTKNMRKLGEFENWLDILWS